MHRRHALAALLGLALPALVADPAAARSYRYVDLGLVTPVAVSSRNVVAAEEIRRSTGGLNSQLYVAVRIAESGAATYLAPLRDDGRSSAFPYDIAADGSIVGTAFGQLTSGESDQVSVIWPGTSTAPRPLAAAEGGAATAIAPTADIVVGYHWRFNGTQNVTVPWVSTRTGDAADAGGEEEMLVDVNDAGDRLIRHVTTGTLIRNGTRVPLPSDFDVESTPHPLGEDGGIAGARFGDYAASLRKPDGTVVGTGVEGFGAAATQGGAIVGSVWNSQTLTSRAAIWKSGKLTYLDDVVPGRPKLERPVDLAPSGTIVGWNLEPGDPLHRNHGWMLLYQVRITGQVVEPSLPPASPAGPGARAATRPVKGARVVLTPAGGAAVTVTTDAQGRFSADIPAGKVAITLPGRSGCVTAGCTSATIDAQDDTSLDVRLDPKTRPTAPVLPKAPIRVRRGALPLTLRCRLVSAPCRITATIRQKRKVLATAALTVKAGKSATRTLPLTKAGKAALASGVTANATLTLVTRTPTGRTTTTVSVRLRR